MLSQEEFDMIIEVLKDSVERWEKRDPRDPKLVVLKGALRKLEAVAPG